MLSTRIGLLAAVIAFTADLAAAAEQTMCPEDIEDAGKRYRLERASVFDGPPEELADLIPVNGRWDLLPYRATDRKLYLVCRYKNTKAVNTMVIPTNARQCVQAGSAKIRVACQ
jgi:hypothetical protein